MADVNDGFLQHPARRQPRAAASVPQYVAPPPNVGTINTPPAAVQMFRDAEHRVAGLVTLEELPSTFWVRCPAVPANVFTVAIDVPPEGETTVYLTTFDPPVTTLTHMVEPPLWMKPCPCPLWDILMPED